MTDSSRIRGGKTSIDYAATQSFFEERGRRNYRSALSTTMYQDNDPELVEQRDKREKEAVAGILAAEQAKCVLDIGCGIGRWGWFLAERRPDVEYLGIDFSSALIEKASQEAVLRECPQLRFQVMSATDIQPQALALQPPYDLILISGLLIYLNDDDCLKLIQDAGRLCAPNGRIYIREPVGIEERFTLDRFYSNELADEYSAIYRTISELDEIIAQALVDARFARKVGDFLFPETLEKRAETRQYYTILQREGE
ncbi:MAG: class I SAM-dependent methyltransferase [Moraxellaceae bacterium]|nr:class I SAM-dependent methyltransferase [Moraxellaceae bacterium]